MTMYTNTSSPIMLIKGEAAKKIFDSPKQSIPNRNAIIKKAKEHLRKAGYVI